MSQLVIVRRGKELLSAFEFRCALCGVLERLKLLDGCTVLLRRADFHQSISGVSSFFRPLTEPENRDAR